MPKIVSSDLAPAEKVHYDFGVASFDLTEKGSFETTDPAVLAEAAVHPWLSVEYGKVEVISGTFTPPSVRPEDDPLSAQHPDAKLAFDSKAVKAALAEHDARVGNPTAIDVALDQDKNIVEGDVSKTVAADAKATAKAEKTEAKS